MSDEDQRARLWREQQKAMQASRQRYRAMLSGSPLARKVLEDEWRAMTLWLQERRSK